MKQGIDQSSLNNEYTGLRSLYEDFCFRIIEQIQESLKEHKVVTGFQLEKRVKDFASIADKIEREGLNIKSVQEVNDLAGVRIILLFKNDIQVVRKIIKDNFKVLKEENTTLRLGENEFGYGSIHFDITAPSSWNSIGTLKKFKGVVGEIQLRTAAQHIWAAASHVLQYKKEQDIHPNLRRNVYRVSALLETVDLEIERIAVEKKRLLQEKIKTKGNKSLINVITLTQLLRKHFPAENEDTGREEYSDLISDLFEFNVTEVEQLSKIISKHIYAVLEKESHVVELLQGSEPTEYYAEPERIQRGLFYNYTGLTRLALGFEFGEKFEKWLNKNSLNRIQDIVRGKLKVG